jgi:hypothetical protein
MKKKWGVIGFLLAAIFSVGPASVNTSGIGIYSNKNGQYINPVASDDKDISIEVFLDPEDENSSEQSFQTENPGATTLFLVVSGFVGLVTLGRRKLFIK